MKSLISLGIKIATAKHGGTNIFYWTNSCWWQGQLLSYTELLFSQQLSSLCQPPRYPLFPCVHEYYTVRIKYDPLAGTCECGEQPACVWHCTPSGLNCTVTAESLSHYKEADEQPGHMEPLQRIWDVAVLTANDIYTLTSFAGICKQSLISGLLRSGVHSTGSRSVQEPIGKTKAFLPL